jgi:Sulfatase
MTDTVRLNGRAAPRGLLLGCTLLALTVIGAQAQQTTGAPGSPGATTTIDGKQLPPPDPRFGGVIKDDALQSKPWWAPRVVPPKSAPSVLLIITDDAGFGVPSTFGRVIPTPTMDRIAKEGLRYNRVFSTALCSPTRAALITGRNHHSAGFGVISEQSTGFPGYNSIIGKDKATIGRILLDNGYGTSWFGKDHNTPAFAASQARRKSSRNSNRQTVRSRGRRAGPVSACRSPNGSSRSTAAESGSNPSRARGRRSISRFRCGSRHKRGHHEQAHPGDRGSGRQSANPAGFAH